MPTWTIQIRAAEDDSPIPGAQVALGVRLGRREGFVSLAETDREGGCQVHCDLADDIARSVDVMAHAPGRDARQMGIGDLGSQPTILRLAQGPTIRGRVSDENDDPVEGASVDLRRHGRTGDEEPEWYGSTPWPPPVTTDADGRYVLPWFSSSWQGQPEGDELALTIDHPEFAPWQRRGVQSLIPRIGDAEFDAVLSPLDASSAAPTSIDPCEPWPEERVPLRISVLCGAARRRASEGAVWMSLVDAPRFSFWVPIEKDGHTAHRLIPSGTYRAQVTVPGAATTHAKVRVDSTGCSPHALRVRRGRRVAGRVTDRDGRPVAGCFVQFASVLAHVTPQARATTDDRGHYELPGVRGLCWMSFQARGFANADRIRWIQGWLPWRRRLDVVLQRGCVVRGRVVGPNGSPHARTFVQLHSRGRGAQPVCGHTAWTDAEGHFELRNVPSGSALLMALEREEPLTCREGEEVELEVRTG